MNDVEQLNEHTDWSIKLGFKGELTDEFYKKFNSVIKVRNRIKKEISLSLLAFIISSTIYLILINGLYTNDYQETIKISLIFIIMLSIMSILIHFRVVLQWEKHDKKMIEEYRKENYKDV